MTWVFKHSEATLGSRLVLLVLADYAHDDGSRAYPSVETIGQKARMSSRAVRSALRKLEAERRVEVMGKSQFGTVVYRVLMEEVSSSPASAEVHDTEGGKLTTETMSPSSANPSLNPPGEKAPSGRVPEHPSFPDFLLDHHNVTGHAIPGISTRRRREIAASYAARLDEGFSPDDMKLATRGAHSDDYRRERGYDTLESVLRPTKIGALVDKGRRAASAESEKDKWGDDA